METSMMVPFLGMILLFFVYKNIPSRISYEKFLLIIMIISSLLIILTPFLFVSNIRDTEPISKLKTKTDVKKDPQKPEKSNTIKNKSENKNNKNKNPKSSDIEPDPNEDPESEEFDPLSNLTRIKDFGSESLKSLFKHIPIKMSGDKFYLELLTQLKIILNYFLYEDLVLYIMFNLVLKKYRPGLNTMRHFMKLALSIFLMNSIIPLFYFLLDRINLTVLIFSPFVIISILQMASVLIMYYGIDFYTIRFYIFMKQKVIQFKH